MTFRIGIPHDWQKIEEFCNQNNVRLPMKRGFEILAEDENGNLTGYANIELKTFIDPLAVDEKLSDITKVRLIGELTALLRGVLMGAMTKEAYFTESNANMIRVLEKHFEVRKYTDEPTFIGRV